MLCERAAASVLYFTSHTFIARLSISFTFQILLNFCLCICVITDSISSPLCCLTCSIHFSFFSSSRSRELCCLCMKRSVVMALHSFLCIKANCESASFTSEWTLSRERKHSYESDTVRCKKKQRCWCGDPTECLSGALVWMSMKQFKPITDYFIFPMRSAHICLLKPGWLCHWRTGTVTTHKYTHKKQAAILEYFIIWDMTLILSLLCYSITNIRGTDQLSPFGTCKTASALAEVVLLLTVICLK